MPRIRTIRQVEGAAASVGVGLVLLSVARDAENPAGARGWPRACARACARAFFIDGTYSVGRGAVVVVRGGLVPAGGAANLCAFVVAVLHGSASWTQRPQPCLASCGADVVRASELQHAVQGTDGDAHLGRPAPARARA